MTFVPPHCTCGALNHPLHRAGECDEPATARGGICATCRYAGGDARKIADGPHLRCSVCGNVTPVEPHSSMEYH